MLSIFSSDYRIGLRWAPSTVLGYDRQPLGSFLIRLSNFKSYLSYQLEPIDLKAETERRLAPTEKVTEESITYFRDNIGGEKYKNCCAEWLSTLKTYDKTSCCGRVWGSEYIAYRCRTCAKNSCMSLCADCFEDGNHENHDFNMFRFLKNILKMQKLIIFGQNNLDFV